jgi:hypothetical protein
MLLFAGEKPGFRVQDERDGRQMTEMVRWE